MDRSDIEENNAKCNVCSGGLSTIEVILYGNRCVFCAPIIRNIGVLKFNLMCYYDWQIYREITKLSHRKTWEDKRIDLLACLGVIGYTDINQVKSVKAKRALLKELRGFGK